MYFFDSNSFEWIKVLVGPDKRLKGKYQMCLNGWSVPKSRIYMFLIYEKELHPEAPWCHQPADRKCHTLNQVGDYVYITGGQYM